MSTSMIAQRLAAAGHPLPPTPQPLASYVPAVRSGNYVYTSGQLPMVDGQLAESGKVGDSVTPERAKELAAICIVNALAAVVSTGVNLDHIRIVKVVGFVASTTDFTGQPGVINGASELLGEVFGDRGIHARSAVGVPVLPIDTPVEIELIAEVVDPE